MKASDPVTLIMTTDLITVGTSSKLSEVRRLMVENSIHHIPVVDGRRLLGIVSYSDILELSYTEYVTDAKQRDAFLDERCTLSALMNSDIVTVSSNATLRDAAKALAGGKIHSVPVVDGKGHLSGLVTSTDLIRTLLV
jgi:CBS domain-containing protein